MCVESWAQTGLQESKPGQLKMHVQFVPSTEQEKDQEEP